MQKYTYNIAALSVITNTTGFIFLMKYARGWNGQIVVLNLNKEALEWDYPLVKVGFT